jgi:hypothetical protein
MSRGTTCDAAAEADEARLRELCSELLGPPRAVSSTAEPAPSPAAAVAAASAVGGAGQQLGGDGSTASGGGGSERASAGQRPGAQGGWQPTVLGIDKRDLLRKEVL